MIIFRHSVFTLTTSITLQDYPLARYCQKNGDYRFLPTVPPKANHPYCHTVLCCPSRLGGIGGTRFADSTLPTHVNLY